MFDALGNALQYVVQTGQRREVNRYLDNTTQGTVLKHLLKAFSRRKTEIRDLERVFQTQAQEDHSTKQRYWSEESLRGHVENIHPNLASSKSIIQLLWRSFYFFAFHPFPQDPTGGRVDWEAFQRAISMLVAQGADLLGVLEEIESFWRLDGDDFYHQAKVKKIFRSIGTPERCTQMQQESIHIVEETTDVLAMTQPFFIHNGPYEHQLAPAAKRLLGENNIQTCRRVTRNDFALLLSVLIRLRLHKGRWGLSFPFGSFEEARPGDDELATILVNALGGDQRRDDIGFDQVLPIMYLLPNLYLRFYQMWAAIFQPPMTSEPITPSQVPRNVPDRVLSAISLFIPYPTVSTLGGSREEDNRIALEDSFEPSQGTDGAIMTKVNSALVESAAPHLVLITGTDTATSEVAVIEAYLPPGSTGVALHLFFQLQPRFRLLRWNGASKGLMDRMYADDESLSEANSVSETSDDCRMRSPFGLNHPKNGCIYLKVDPVKKLAYLADHAKGREGLLEVAFSHFSVLGVSGGGPAVLPGLAETCSANVLPGVIQNPPEVRIYGKELKERIRGFGSY